MSLFNQSIKAVSAVCQEIADSAGASSDSEMTTRAARSLFAGLEHFNNRANWEFALAEATPIAVFGPFGITATVSAGQVSATAGPGHGLRVDDLLSGPGWQVGTRITATAAGSFGFSLTTSATAAGATSISATAVRDLYDLPADYKAPYSASLLSTSPGILTLIRRRFYDRSTFTPFSPSTPGAYDIFMIGAKGKVRLLQPPSSADLLQLRYYRRMTVPTTSATADALDIPQDYEPYLIAWAKWHFLIDKGEGRSEQAQTWLSLSQEGLVTMLRDQTRVPDESLMMIPGAYTYSTYGNDNTTRNISWEQG